MTSTIANAPARLIKDFRKAGDKPSLKGALIQEDCYVGDHLLDTLVAIKSKEELIGDIIGMLQAPARNIISALQAKAEKSTEEAPEEQSA
jgi:large subunit ribosomal protein L10